MAVKETKGQRPNAIPAEDVVARIGKLDVVHFDPRVAQACDQTPRMLDWNNRVLSAMDDEKRGSLLIDVRQRRGIAVDIGNLRERPAEERRGELVVAGIRRRDRRIRRAGEVDNAGNPARVALQLRI